MKVAQRLWETVEQLLVSLTNIGAPEIVDESRLNGALTLLQSDGWTLTRRDVVVGDWEIDYETKNLVVTNQDVDTATSNRSLAGAVRRVYQSLDDLRLKAIFETAVSRFFDKANSPSDLEAMATLFDWAAWFWDGPRRVLITGFMADMVTVLTGRTPALSGVGARRYDVLSQTTTRGADTGFKLEYRDGSPQVRHATMSIQASLLYGPLGWAWLQERELLENGVADWRLNNACLDIAARLSGRQLNCTGIGDLIRNELGDPTQTQEYAGPAGGMPD